MTEATKLEPSKRLSKWIMLGLGAWLILLMAASLWFQQQYVSSFITPQNSESLLSNVTTQAWYDRFTSLIPAKKTPIRVVQFWRPDCLCNRFARTHATDTISKSAELKIEHLTVIPERFSGQVDSLQSLNPDTRIVTLNENLMETWPQSPAIFLEDVEGQVQYFGPLGYGAFCTQASTSIIERQIIALQNKRAHPFFNVLGQGCFCPWQADNI